MTHLKADKRGSKVARICLRAAASLSLIYYAWLMLDLITHLFSPGFNAGSIPSLIDRGFYRQKYDAARALQTYSFTARREVELANLTANLVGLVNKTVQPKQFSIWIRPFYRKLTEEK